MLTRCLLKLAALLGFLGASVYIMAILSKNNYLFRPFIKVGQVVSLLCYPVAGCRGMIGRTAICTTGGLKLMGVCDKQFVIARKCSKDFARSSPHGMLKEFYTPHMDSVEAFSNGKDLILLAPDRHDFVLTSSVIKRSLELFALRIDMEQLWRGSNVMIARRLEEASSWIQSSLEQKDIGLYQILDQIICSSPGRGCRGNYVIAVKESIDYINSKLQPDPFMLAPYFRPNIILSGCEPMDECQWSHLKIGKVYFEVTCLDSSIVSDHVRSEDKGWKSSWEPPPELPQDVAAFSGNNLALDIGVNARVVRPGEIHVGDPVFAALKFK